MSQDKANVVPNTRPAGPDRVLDPTLVTVPMVLIENCIGDPFWHHEVMDRCAAERFVDSVNAGKGATAVIVEVPIILPCAADIDDVLNDLNCEPIRIALTEIPDPHSIDTCTGSRTPGPLPSTDDSNDDGEVGQ